jgi:hypothetical protein
MKPCKLKPDVAGPDATFTIQFIEELEADPFVTELTIASGRNPEASVKFSGDQAEIILGLLVSSEFQVHVLYDGTFAIAYTGAGTPQSLIDAVESVNDYGRQISEAWSGSDSLSEARVVRVLELDEAAVSFAMDLASVLRGAEFTLDDMLNPVPHALVAFGEEMERFLADAADLTAVVQCRPELVPQALADAADEPRVLH